MFHCKVDVGFTESTQVLFSSGLILAKAAQESRKQRNKIEQHGRATSRSMWDPKTVREFFRRLKKIGRILVPSWRSREARSIALITFLLISRSVSPLTHAHKHELIVQVLSLTLLEIIARNTQCLVARRWKDMAYSTFMFSLVSIPASFIHSGLNLELSTLTTRFRRRLIAVLHDAYFCKETLYNANAFPSGIASM
jgi:ATP-binding cassette subfamily D (ALD) long-chain fatty acid import protein